MAESAAPATSELSCGNCPLHMILDKKTEMYIKFGKVMVICQGPITDDRKTAPETIEEKFPSSSRILSDKTYVSENMKPCSAEGTEHFYEYLRMSATYAFETGFNLIYIDTTMSNLGQNQFYCSLADQMQYVTLIMPPFVAKRDVKANFPKGSQADSFREINVRIETPNMFQHLFCGWFLHDRDTEELQAECALYIEDLLEMADDFAPWFAKVSPDVKFTEYYGLNQEKKKLGLKEDLAFCPVKVFNSDNQMTEYFLKKQVADNYGKMSKLKIFGFIISPHMVAARVKLTYNQKCLWDMDDIVSEDSDILCPTELYKQSKASLPNVKVGRICSKSNTTLMKAETVFEPEKIVLPNSKGRTCHIVIGAASDAPARNIDYDVAFALSREYKADKEKLKIDLFKIRNFLVKRIGKYWFVYLHDTLTVNGLFASCVKPCDFDIPVSHSFKKLSLKH